MEWRGHIARYGEGWFPGEPWVRRTFVLLFILAGLLRLWNLPHLPYTHDELSALMRLYPTLGETIHRGVMELDTHPPGVHVFEWCWTRLFGTDEAWVKLPFILLALVALFFHYRFALAWTSAGTALAMTALLASLQYTVLYAQIARPYAFGFFTVAWLADALTRYLAFGTRRSLAAVGMASVLCAYTHHFSLLLAAIMVLSACGLVPTSQRKQYLSMSIIAVLAYTPNLFLFVKQLALGGLGGWLAPPDHGWLLGYITWILHFSPGLMICTALVLSMAVLGTLRKGSLPSPVRWFLPLWALAPLMIGYGYSVWRQPVLQYSMLLFSFPFMVCWAFVGLRHASRTFVLGATAVLALAATKTLISDRQHYTVFSDSPYAAMVRVAVEQVNAHGAASTLVVFDAPRPQVEFYIRRHGLDTLCTIHWPREQSGSLLLSEALHNARIQQVVLGTTNGHLPERQAQVQALFPHILRLQDHVEGQVRVFAKTTAGRDILDRKLVAELKGGHSWGFSKVDASLPMEHDGRTRTSNWIMKGMEFGLASTYPLQSGTYNPRTQFEVELHAAQTMSSDTLAVVLALRSGTELLIHRGTALPRTGVTCSTVAALSPSWLPKATADAELTTYAYDRSKHVHASLFWIRLYQRFHNPVVNALLEPISGPWHHE